ncbi:MAG: hypothetical protein ACI9MR_000876 [Myxococcota bacterium]|jgi:hypothetical protein
MSGVGGSGSRGAIGAGIAVGAGMTIVLHAALGWALTQQDWGAGKHVGVELKSEDSFVSAPLTLCRGGQRCAAVERRRRRAAPEPPPLEELEIIEATLIPALGEADPEETKKLPEIVAYEQPEKVEEAINIDNEFYTPKPLIKAPETLEAKLEPDKPKSDLSKLIDYDNTDPRANRKSLDSIIGTSDGDAHGQGYDKRAGNRYSGKASRAIQRVFKTPPFLDAFTMRTLKTRVLVTRLGFGGEIQSYRIIKRSGNKGFDEAALAAIKQFVPAQGGSKALPMPPKEVLLHINTKGLTITLDGGRMRR